MHSLSDPHGRLAEFLEDFRQVLNKRGSYALCIGSTETSDIEGISAAGADSESRRLTPAIDAEAIVERRSLSSAELPKSPLGIVSPVVLSRAMLDVINPSISVYDCGAFYPPQVSHNNLGGRPASRIDSGQALPLEMVRRLFDAGKEIGELLARENEYIIVGECIPAGTTTALGVLTALGYSAMRLVSSSMPESNHVGREELVKAGLMNSGLNLGQFQSEPLRTVAAVGDPMQPVAAGIALSAATKIPVVLGGGTQMLAVYALAKALADQTVMRDLRLAVITTKWVAYDSKSNPAKLAQLVQAPFAASCPDLSQSRHYGLRAYEEGNVKEGVAAGALMGAAFLKGLSAEEIVESIDRSYDAMVPSV